MSYGPNTQMRWMLWRRMDVLNFYLIILLTYEDLEGLECSLDDTKNEDKSFSEETKNISSAASKKEKSKRKKVTQLNLLLCRLV